MRAAQIPRASTDALDLIARLCHWDPARRPTAAEALRHPFFQVSRMADAPHCCEGLICMQCTCPVSGAIWQQPCPRTLHLLDCYQFIDQSIDFTEVIYMDGLAHNFLTWSLAILCQVTEVPPHPVQHQLAAPKKEQQAQEGTKRQVSIHACAGPRMCPSDSILAHYPGSAFSSVHLPPPQRTVQQQQQPGSCSVRAFSTAESIGGSRALSVIGGQLLASFSKGGGATAASKLNMPPSMPRHSCAAAAAPDLKSTPTKPAQPGGAKVALLQGLGKGFAGSPSRSHAQDSARGGGGVLRSGLRRTAAALDQPPQQQLPSVSVNSVSSFATSRSSAQQRAESSSALGSACSVHGRSIGPKPTVCLSHHSQHGAPLTCWNVGCPLPRCRSSPTFRVCNLALLPAAATRTRYNWMLLGTRFPTYPFHTVQDALREAQAASPRR